MIDVLLIALPIIVIAALYFMGRSFAVLQIKKRASFEHAFGRSALLVSALTVLVFIPFAAAAYFSASQFPGAIQEAYGSTTMYMEQLISGLLTIFSGIAIPFMLGIWVRYRALPEAVQA